MLVVAMVVDAAVVLFKGICAKTSFAILVSEVAKLFSSDLVCLTVVLSAFNEVELSYDFSTLIELWSLNIFTDNINNIINNIATAMYICTIQRDYHLLLHNRFD